MGVSELAILSLQWSVLAQQKIVLFKLRSRLQWILGCAFILLSFFRCKGVPCAKVSMNKHEPRGSCCSPVPLCQSWNGKKVWNQPSLNRPARVYRRPGGDAKHQQATSATPMKALGTDFYTFPFSLDVLNLADSCRFIVSGDFRGRGFVRYVGGKTDHNRRSKTRPLVLPGELSTKRVVLFRVAKGNAWEDSSRMDGAMISAKKNPSRTQRYKRGRGSLGASSWAAL